jgi:hypothetical protein
VRDPFAIIHGVIGEHETILRPVKFNDEDFDKEYRRSNGEFIVPIAAVTTCPMCGGLVEQDIPEGTDLSVPIQINCPTCAPAPVHRPDDPFPFSDPIERGVLTLFDVNPTALNIAVNFFDEPVDTSVVDKNDMVEVRSEGLGQFMRKRDMWDKSGKSKEATDPHADIFDIMGDLVDESFVNQTDSLEDNLDLPEKSTK